MSITVTLPDGTPLELPEGATGADAAAAIGSGLARAALAIEVGDPGAADGTPEVRDLPRPLPDGARISILTKRSGEQALQLIRHDAAHVLAAAVMELYPGVSISIGPPIEQGFYYDFEFPTGVSVSEEQFPAIEERMRAHVKAAETFERRDVTPAQARERFVGRGPALQGRADRRSPQRRLADPPVGDGLAVHERTRSPTSAAARTRRAPSPSAPSRCSRSRAPTGAGTPRARCSRASTAPPSTPKANWPSTCERLEQARARDHRKLGRELDLFTFSEVSPGAAFWLPAGTRLWNKLVAVSREMGSARGYTEVKTPLIYDAELWKTSGHWGKYRENMFLAVDSDGEEMGAVKPMNCPGHAHLFSMRRHSYRDLPVRYSEPGLLHRNEPSGVLHGLLRVRHFAQDDAHIFCTEEQVQARGRRLPGAGLRDLRACSTSTCAWSSPPAREERIGDDEMWDRAEGALTTALAEQGLQYELNPGDGAFYGPKIDMHMTDSLGRSWQLGTVQLDYSMPARFGLAYTGADNSEHTPVMIHRACFGSCERFIGIMLEHYAGELPLWLAPVQAIVLPVSDRLQRLRRAASRRSCARGGAYVECDDRGESVGRKIRDAELRKIPYMLIVGEREQRRPRRVGARAPRRRHRRRLASELRRAVARRAILGPVDAPPIHRARRPEPSLTRSSHDS